MTLGKHFSEFLERESHRPDWGRSWRCMVAFMAPLLLALLGRLPFEVTFAAIAAQSIALVDVRGAYRLRFTLLLAMTAILAGVSALGSLAHQPLAAALVATVVIAAGTGLWRHLSSDYGPSIAVSSSLLFFIAVCGHGGAGSALHHGIAAGIGGLWGVILQVALWPINAQHPLRRAVSDSWLAVGDLFQAINPGEPAEPGKRQERISSAEAALRSTLNAGYAALAAVSPRGAIAARLEKLNQAGGHLAMQVSSLNTVMEELAAAPAFAGMDQVFQPLMQTLTNTARTIALAVVSRQPSHFSTAEVRLRRVRSLLQALEARLATVQAGASSREQPVELLRQIEAYLPEMEATLRATIDRAGERSAFSLELFDMDTLKLRPLAAALNFNPRVDRALIRFTARITVLTLIAVTVVKLHALPHSYWFPFTLVVVLQPDYGSTRRKAAQRLLGTLAGSILASLLLWLHMSFWPLMGATAAMSLIFAYFVRRNYGVAVIFITLFVVLLTEANGPATLALTGERMGATLAGGLLALLAALVFWPVWEKELFPPILAKALRANRDYLTLVVGRLRQGGSFGPDAVAAKRRAETANGAVFSSLQRMAGDPKNRQDRIEQAAALANANQRLTRILNLLALQLDPAAGIPEDALDAFSRSAAEALEAVATAIEFHATDPSGLEAAGAALDRLALPHRHDGPARDSLVFSQLARAGTELRAMLVAARDLESEAPRASANKVERTVPRTLISP